MESLPLTVDGSHLIFLMGFTVIFELDIFEQTSLGLLVRETSFGVNILSETLQNCH